MIATRSATAQSDQNPEVIKRARQLDLQLERQRQLSEERQRLQQGLAAVPGRLIIEALHQPLLK
jgi:hypothetical protein